MKNLLCLLGALGFCLVLHAGEPGEPKQKKPQTQDTPMLQDMLRIRDAVTGELRKPTANELKLLMPVNPLNRSDAGLKVVTHKDGSSSVNLEGRFKSVIMARRDASGKLITACVHSEAEARAFMQGKTTPKEHSHDQ